MSLLTKAGVISCPASAGSFGVTGVGFQPKAVIFWGNGELAVGSHGTTASMSTMPIYFGFAQGDGSSATGSCMNDCDDFGGGNPFLDSTNCIRLTSSASTLMAATCLHMDSDGFTLNFATVRTGCKINYLALGGTELQAKRVSQSIPTAGSGKTLTGAGFAPTAAIFLAGSLPASPRTGSVGWASSPSDQGTITSAFSGSVGNYTRSDRCTALVFGSGLDMQGSLTSFDSDGCTLNMDTNTIGYSSNLDVLYLSGVSLKVGHFDQKTSTGTDPHTGVGFQPKALLAISALKTAGTTIGSGGLNWCFGGTDGTNTYVNYKGSNGSGVDNYDNDGTIYEALQDNSTPTALADATFTSFDSDGFTWNYVTAADLIAREIHYFAFGDPAGGVFPPFRPSRMPLGV